MISFLDFVHSTKRLLENADNTVIFSFARMNPPTQGHLLLMKKLVEHGKKHNAVPLLFLSHSHDPKKNPLTYDDKYEIIRRIAPKGLNVIRSSAKNYADAVKEVSSVNGVGTNIIVVAGSDRVADFERFAKYKDDFGFNSLQVVSSGLRDPDAENVSGVSATKLRNYAKDGDYEKFSKDAGTAGNKNLTKMLYDKVREGMGCKNA